MKTANRITLIVFCFFVSLATIPSWASDAAAEAASSTAEVKTAEAADLFAQANSAATESQARELYQQAILRYRYLIEEEHLKNFYVYYDLGNAYQLTGDLGRAILNYRRAALFQPNHPDLLKNLNFARLKRLDNIPAPTPEKVAQTLFFWHYDFSPRTRLILLAGAWGLLWLSALLLMMLKNFRRLLWSSCFVGLIVTLALGVSLGITLYQQHYEAGGVIVAGQVIARQGDGPNYLPAFEAPLHAGTEFTVLEERRDWLYIRLPDASKAWIPADAGQRI